MADLARDAGKGKKREKVFARFRRTSKARFPPLPPSLSSLSLSMYIYIFFFYRLFHLFLFSFLQRISLSLSLVSSNILALLHSSAFVFRRSRISRSYFDPRRIRASSRAESSVFPLLPRFFRFLEEWRDVDQTLVQPTEAKAKDEVGRKETADASFSSFLFLIPA